MLSGMCRRICRTPDKKRSPDPCLNPLLLSGPRSRSVSPLLNFHRNYPQKNAQKQSSKLNGSLVEKTITLPPQKKTGKEEERILIPRQ
jgi:hypothetical protein